MTIFSSNLTTIFLDQELISCRYSSCWCSSSCCRSL